ncbi:hypothetical protein L2E82_40277 [Cichorium intybus]|uniref:Uncharacterized protein n=1 Tax=Cichorium intybus TaxID=13427 RepID=A0ACB9AKD0_CICIN|nr:hypothetical protein L2E82_40277 [Cichorium intybus]
MFTPTCHSLLLRVFPIKTLHNSVIGVGKPVRFLEGLWKQLVYILLLFAVCLSSYSSSSVSSFPGNLIPNQEMDMSHWRARLQPDSRERMVNRIMDAMRIPNQVYGYEGLQELKKMVMSIEEKVFIAATSQSDYMRKICFNILTIETRSQNSMPDAKCVNPSDPEDSRSRVKKISVIRNLCLVELLQKGKPVINCKHKALFIIIVHSTFINIVATLNNEQDWRHGMRVKLLKCKGKNTQRKKGHDSKK